MFKFKTLFDSNNTVCAAIIIALLFTAGCDHTFEPLQENDQYYFSVYGSLDASADTQWVRIMPVRDSLYFSPRPIDAEVTLENVNTGESVVMHDSLFSFVQGVYVYNFWTTMNVEPEQTYRLTARDTTNPEDRESFAEVTLPPDFPTPVVQMATDPGAPDFVYVDGVERLADVQAVFHGRDSTTGNIRLLGIPHRQDTLNATTHDYRIAIDTEDHPDDDDEGNPFPPVIKRQIYVAAAGPGFHDFGTIDEKVIALPEGVSNITNGVGYLAGIVSKTIPYKSCFEGVTLVPCPLEPTPW